MRACRRGEGGRRRCRRIGTAEETPAQSGEEKEPAQRHCGNGLKRSLCQSTGSPMGVDPSRDSPALGDISLGPQEAEAAPMHAVPLDSTRCKMADL